MNWNELLSGDRIRSFQKSTTTRDLRTEFEKDYHRIIGSASFRRLQDKTQVFPLDKSDYVRTRLTHSLEVSSFAKSLSQTIGDMIIKEKQEESPMKTYFPEIKKNFGFGCMRLPLLENGEVDTAVFSEMIDTFIAAGFNYFDTARMYVKEKSEPALKTCLSSRHAREEYLLADKLSNSYFEKEEDTSVDLLIFFASALVALLFIEWWLKSREQN